MARITRRRFLQYSGATGMAGILAAHRAPAFAQASTVHWIRWNDFVPASDELLRKSILPEASKALGMKINFETVNANDLQPRITSAIQSGSGPDIVMLNNNHPQLYAASCADVSDVAEAVAKAQGAYYKLARANTHDGKKYISVPWSVIGAQIAYRKSWFEEVGYSKFPETWDQYRDAGKKLKAKGRPIGQTLGHTFGDSPTFSYPFLWSYGGQEVDEKGKLALDSKATVESVRFMTAFWKDAHDEGGLAWDDSNNNRAFLSGDDLRHAERRLDLHRVAAQGRPVQDREGRAAEERHPACAAAEGSRGPVRHAHVPFARDSFLLEEPEGGEAVPDLDAYAGELREVVRLAEGLRHAADPGLGEAQDVGRGSGDGAVPVAGRLGLTPGHAGPSDRKAAEALTKYIITDMYAKAIQGGDARGGGEVGRRRAEEYLRLASPRGGRGDQEERRSA